MYARLAVPGTVLWYGIELTSGSSLSGTQERKCGKHWPWDEVCSGRGVCHDGTCVCEGTRRGDTCNEVVPSLSKTCPKLGHRHPQSERADDIRPDEIDVVMGMGDSLSLGMGLFAPWFLEQRGWAPFTGGEKDAVTLPNFIKAYNPHLLGSAQGTIPKLELPGTHGRQASFSSRQCAERHWDICGLNAAVDGARVSWMTQEMEWLEMRLEKMFPGGKWKDKWKMLTIWTGLDDIVFGPSINVTHPLPTDVGIVEKEFETLVEKLHQRFPKLLVNVIALPENIDPDVPTLTADCAIAIQSAKFAGMKWVDHKLWQNSIVQYNQMFIRIVERWQKKVCTFSACPMVIALRFGLVRTYLGLHELDPFDCFHLRLRAAEAVSINLWNEMLVGNKPGNGELHWADKAMCLEPQHRFTWPAPKSSGPWTVDAETSHSSWEFVVPIFAGVGLLFLLCCNSQGPFRVHVLRGLREYLIQFGLMKCPGRCLLPNDLNLHQVLEDQQDDDCLSGDEVIGSHKAKYIGHPNDVYYVREDLSGANDIQAGTKVRSMELTSRDHSQDSQDNDVREDTVLDTHLSGGTILSGGEKTTISPTSTGNVDCFFERNHDAHDVSGEDLSGGEEAARVHKTSCCSDHGSDAHDASGDDLSGGEEVIELNSSAIPPPQPTSLPHSPLAAHRLVFL